MGGRLGEFYAGLGDELSLFVRHLAWLQAVPKHEHKQLSDTSEPVSRLEQQRADGLEPDMPPQPAPHLIEYLMEAGPVELAGMDRAPISWATLDCWQRLTGVVLEPWQARLLRRLSSEYLNESRRATKPECPPPWNVPGSPDARAAVDAKIRRLFGAFAKGG